MNPATGKLECASKLKPELENASLEPIEGIFSLASGYILVNNYQIVAATSCCQPRGQAEGKYAIEETALTACLCISCVSR